MIENKIKYKIKFKLTYLDLNLETGLSINSSNNDDDITIENLSMQDNTTNNTNTPTEKVQTQKSTAQAVKPTVPNKYTNLAKRKFVLNKNILDKFSRILERKLFNVNILIAKIFDNLLEPENFEILSDDFNMLINFSNEVLNLLDTIKSTLVAPRLSQRCYSFLQFLIKSNRLSEEQAESINEIIVNFPLRNSSETFKNVIFTINNIIKNYILVSRIFATKNSVVFY